VNLFGIVVAFAGVAVVAQQPKPTFEVASVRASSPGNLSEINYEFRPERFVGRMLPLRALIAIAHASEGREPAMERIVGGPAWVDTVLFDIQATTGSPAPPRTMRLMLQTLLEERFGLWLVSEQRMMDAYALVVARSDGRLGPQLKPAQVKDCSQLTFDQRRERRCGDGAYVDKETMTRYVYGSDKDIDGFISHVISVAGTSVSRPIVNRTGLTGRFDYEVQSNALEGRLSPSAAEPPRAPEFFTALREQLGLRLEPVRAPISVLVIDAVHEPTEN
jgi:uncharacterized protein (TIGR03435 family)